MVPGSTLMYGSSLRIETCRPRALRSLPMLAAVMPLPSEEVTPPVTKTYFAMGQVLRGFFECYRKVPAFANRESGRPAGVEDDRLRGVAADGPALATPSPISGTAGCVPSRVS